MYERIRGPHFGRLEATPTAFEVDSRQSFQFKYTAGQTPIEEGGKIRLLIPVPFSTPNLISSEQKPLGWAPGFTSVEQKPVDVEVKLSIEPPPFGFWMSNDIVITVVSGCLKQGDEVCIRYGGRLSKVLVSKMAGAGSVFRALVDPDGSGKGPHAGWTFLEEDVQLQHRPKPALRMECFVPSVCEDKKGPERVHIVKKDGFHNVSEVQQVSRNSENSEKVRVVVAKHGKALRVQVQDAVTGLARTSNPSTPVREDGLKLFWGDLHNHTRISDDATAGDPASVCAYGRDQMNLDFVGLTDHANDMRLSEWETVRDAARAYTEPGRFIAFAGFEFNSRELENAKGQRRRLDRNVHYLDPDRARLPAGISRDDYRHTTTEEILEHIDTSTELIIPHQHPGGAWDVAGREKMRLIEIYSHWGCYEREDTKRTYVMGKYQKGALVDEALEEGLRLGFVGGSDCHSGVPGNDYLWRMGNYSGGLTAVWAKELTPAALFEALYARRCYATTRSRIWLSFEVNGAAMGSEIKVSAPQEPRQISVEFHGTETVAEVVLIKNNQALKSWSPADRDGEFEFVDETGISPRGWDNYYLRAEQEDGETAWASPVWVDGPSD